MKICHECGGVKGDDLSLFSTCECIPFFDFKQMVVEAPASIFPDGCRGVILNNPEIYIQKSRTFDIVFNGKAIAQVEMQQASIRLKTELEKSIEQDLIEGLRNSSPLQTRMIKKTMQNCGLIS